MTQHLTIDSITDYVHSALPAGEDALTHEHLQVCAECRAAYDAEVRIGEELRRALAAQEVDLPSLVKARIWEEIRAARPSAWSSALGLFRPAFAVPAVVALALLAFFAHPFAPNASAPPMVDAMYYLEEHAAEQTQTALGERSNSAVLDSAQTTVSDAGPEPAGPLGIAVDAASLYALP